MKGIQGEFTAVEKRCQKADQEVPPGHGGGRGVE